MWPCMCGSFDGFSPLLNPFFGNIFANVCRPLEECLQIHVHIRSDMPESIRNLLYSVSEVLNVANVDRIKKKSCSYYLISDIMGTRISLV